MTSSELICIVNKVALPAEPPTRMLLVPWGEVHSKKGVFKIDQMAADAIVKEFKRHRVDLVTDKEHQTLGGPYSAPNGEAPAVCWIKTLDVVPGEGIYGDGVEWTPRGAELVRNKEYRYLSPVLLSDRETGKVFALHSVALTNKPAIEGMPAIINKESVMDERIDWARNWLGLPITATPKEIIMELEKLVDQFKAMLGDGAPSEATAVVASVKAKLAELDTLKKERVAICKAMSIVETAKETEIIAAFSAAKSTVAPADPAKFVSLDEHKKLAAEFTALKADVVEKDTAAFIDGGVKAGKIVEATKPMWVRSYKADAVTAVKELDASPVIAPPNGTVTKQTATGAPKDGDVISVNSEKFNGERMAAHQRVTEYMKAHKVGYSAAVEALGV